MTESGNLLQRLFRIGSLSRWRFRQFGYAGAVRLRTMREITRLGATSLLWDGKRRLAHRDYVSLPGIGMAIAEFSKTDPAQSLLDLADGEIMKASAFGFALEPTAIGQHPQRVDQRFQRLGEAESQPQRLPENGPEADFGHIDGKDQPATRLQDTKHLGQQMVVRLIGVAAGLRIARFGIGNGQARNDAVEGSIRKLRQSRAEIADLEANRRRLARCGQLS